MKKYPLLNTYINKASMTEAVEYICDLVNEGKKSYIVPVNVDVIVKIEKDSELKMIVDNAELVLADGKPLLWIAKLFKIPICEKVSGSDLVPELCHVSAEKGYKLFILGGKKSVVERAKENLQNMIPGINIVGTYSPPMGFEKDDKELSRINRMISEAGPDILIVCLGCPKQERWIYHNFNSYNATVSICAGATVDFLAGNVRRAPAWMSEYGLEWFYRFVKEPMRLFKRYFIDDTAILGLAWKYRGRGRKNL